MLAPTGYQVAVSLMMSPCSHNFSVGVHRCWLSQEATWKVQVTEMVPYLLYHLAHGLVQSCREILSSVVFISLLIKHDSDTSSGYDQEDWFYACSSFNLLLFHLPIPRVVSPQRSFVFFFCCNGTALDGIFLEEYTNVTCLLI